MLLLPQLGESLGLLPGLKSGGWVSSARAPDLSHYCRFDTTSLFVTLSNPMRALSLVDVPLITR
jgi:hypothetical protein